MDTTCPILENGTHAIGWIYSIFGDCVYGWQETTSLILGYLSIFCWLNAQMPQVIKNYRIRDADGLSFSFLTVWLSGDVANFIGCIITGQLPFQIILSVYFTIIDTILCAQWLYYVKYTDNRIRRWIDGNHDEMKPVTVLGPVERIYTTYSTGGGKEIDEQTPLTHSTSNSNHKKYTGLLLFFGLVTFGGISSPSDLFTVNDTTTNSMMMMVSISSESSNEDYMIWVGRLFAWICTFLYLSSRLPQIYQNFRRRSVEGLSMALFFFAAMGNLTYVLSIFTNPHATRASMLESVPYIIGSAGTLVFDFTIFAQYALFKKIPTAGSIDLVVPV
ncbi:PQ loop repeat-domain-containing protein [Pilaira anomala]|nr:PQ loop repeat-domain-containing protein [Pilaira anomala]